MAIELISKIKPKNGGTFPMVDAEDVLMPDGSRLSNIDSYIGGMFVSLTQSEYDALVAAGTVDANKYYLIVGDDE